MQKLLKITQQTLWQSVVKLITTLAGFLILGIVSRTYGEAGVGHYTLALTYLAFFYIFVDFSFNAHVLHRLQGVVESSQQEEWRKLLGTRIVWSFILMVISLLVLILLPANFSAEFKIGALLGAVTILFYALNITAHAFFQAKLYYQYDILPALTGAILGVLSILWLANWGVAVYFMILGHTLARFIHGFGSLAYVLKFNINLSPIFDKTYAIKLFKDVWPMALTLVLNVVYFRADVFILSYYKSSADVGIYNLSYQVFQAVLVLPTFAMNSFYPMMLQTLRINIQRFGNQIKLAALSLILVALFTVLTTYYLSPFVIKLITGTGFAGSVESLKILSFGFPAYFLSSLLMWVLVAKKMYKKMLLVYGLGLIFNLMANLIFIPQHGYIAASWITGISEYLILGMQVMILWFKR